MLLNHIRRTVKGKLLSLGNSDFLKSALSAWGNPFSIFCFHRVLPSEEIGSDYDPNNEFTVSTDFLDEFLTHLAKSHRFCSMDEVIKNLNCGFSGKIAHVTFDDGYKDILIHAIPILEKHNVPATIYITTRFAEGDAWMWWHELWSLVLSKNSIVFSANKNQIQLKCETREEKRRSFNYLRGKFSCMDIEAQKNTLANLTKLSQRPSYADLCLTWREIKQLGEHPLIAIGAHTHSHPNLSVETDDCVAYELAHCKALLEAHIKGPIDHLAYPYGGHDQFGVREIELAKALGYTSAVTTICGKWNDGAMLKLPRYLVTAASKPSILDARISGLCNFLGRQLL